jgi:hypothetical protein
MSLFPVEKKKIIEVSEYVLEIIKKERQDYFERSVKSTMEDNKGGTILFFFKKKPMTREEAVKIVRNNFGSLWDGHVFMPLWVRHGEKEEAQATKLLNASKITCENIIQLDRDDAAFLTEWAQRKNKI